MKESAIRDYDDIEIRRENYRRDQEALLRHKDRFVAVACPACAADASSLFYRRDGFEFRECAGCGTVYVSPRPSEALLAEHYRTSISERYWSEVVYPRSEEGRMRHLVEPRVKAILSLCDRFGTGERGLAVDVGAGPGTFAAVLREQGGFGRVVAVEPSPVNAAFCRKKGLEVVEAPLDEVRGLSDADLVVSIECLEHVFDPAASVRAVCGLLRPGGLFVLTVPNIRGFDLLLLRDRSDNTTAPDHLNYFHPESLGRLLERLGLEVLSLSTPGKLDVELVRSKVLEGLFRVDDQPFLKRLLVDDYETLGPSFQEWLAANGLSSHLFAVARKPLLRP
ncbi:Methyltransferase type 11 (plasmid) [Solidesulfovibrio carbinoliphilus subsp. oakridgensis]|uniref:Methyltransferase type 11 n=1 Tax=Solidesulfovibrio carbinoliphilus subsp. oakridgensis TaxID=694327 RepID=G7QE79_9BACT|nr:class I SAM-dependent methyltransferase [Solidesulfovibrio carbinoliphilus]EHJ45973.1 Methyltransferase type 11 [Solidesulfovibrio carbinoliphilus subsp. oakridgensis]